MTWLAPLGFLGLIGIVALIIIYVIKPNYQKKMVSSTFVWKLSLKYRKKRLPVSQLNNVLIFLCQLIILTICGLLLARPVIEAAKAGDENEKVIIIDASASMRVNDGGRTRFERAVSEARLLAEQTIGDGGVVSVILADTDPEYIVQRTGADKLDYVLASIDALLEDGDKCTYSSADMSAAVALTEEVLRYNYEAQVFLYTGTEYLVKNGINVVDGEISDGQTGEAGLEGGLGLDLGAQTGGLSLLGDLDLLDGSVGGEGDHDGDIAAVALTVAGDNGLAVVSHIDVGDVLHGDTLDLLEGSGLGDQFLTGSVLGGDGGSLNDGGGHAVGGGQSAGDDNADGAQHYDGLKDLIPVAHLAAPPFLTLAMPSLS